MSYGKSIATEWGYLLPAWAVCIVLPMPLLILEHSPLGRGYALMLFFVGAMVVVAYSFRREVLEGKTPAIELAQVRRLWRTRISALVTALAFALLAFTMVSILVNNPYNYGTMQGLQDQGIWWRAFVFETPRDFAAPLLALMAVGAAICIVPYFVLATRKPIAAVVFSAALVGCMKLLGALVVVSIYGWDSDEQGRLGMPWNNPDLLVWLFWGFSATLSITCYVLGRRRFVRQYSNRMNSAPQDPLWSSNRSALDE
jgi:hypothetical protein